MKRPPNDSQIENLINGNEEVLKTLYSIVFPKVLTYIKRNSGSYTDAEDIFQSALFQLITRAKVKRIQIKSSFEAYVFITCKNLWLKEVNDRKKEVRKNWVLELKEKEEKTIASILDQERWDLFDDKFKVLTDNCRALLEALFRGVSYSDIVKKFKYSSENVAFQRVFKCKKKLINLIKSDSRYQKLI